MFLNILEVGLLILVVIMLAGVNERIREMERAFQMFTEALEATGEEIKEEMEQRIRNGR